MSRLRDYPTTVYSEPEMRAALYARVSTADREQDPETQLLELRGLCHGLGWTIAGVYVDHASALDYRGRVEWRQLLEAARRRHFDVVVVWKLDRFARSTTDALMWLEQLRGAGVGLKVATQDIDTTSAHGRLVFEILAAVSEFERELARDRIRAGMERARAAGKSLGRPKRELGVEQLRDWPKVRDAINRGELTRYEGARRLKVRYGELVGALQRFRNGVTL